MKIITKIDIKIRTKDILKFQTRKTNISPQIVKGALKSIPVALSLIEPMIAYKFLKIHKITDEKVFIVLFGNKKPYVLNIGPHTNLLHNAKTIMLSVHTIGPRLDEQVKQLNNTGQYLEGYFLDCAGIVALNEIGKQGQKIVEKRAKNMNWGVSSSLSPGSLEGWKISDQKNLCSILDIKKTGIMLTDSCLLIPHKTVSTLIGIGPEYTSHKVGSICKFCNFRNRCK